LRSALASKVADGKLIVVNAFDVKEPKTKQFRQVLDALKVETTALLVEVPRHGNRNLALGSRNLEGVELVHGNEVHPYHLLRLRPRDFFAAGHRSAAGFAEELDFEAAAPGGRQRRRKSEEGLGSPRRRSRHEKAAEVA